MPVYRVSRLKVPGNGGTVDLCNCALFCLWLLFFQFLPFRGLARRRPAVHARLPRQTAMPVPPVPEAWRARVAHLPPRAVRAVMPVREARSSTSRMHPPTQPFSPTAIFASVPHLKRLSKNSPSTSFGWSTIRAAWSLPSPKFGTV